MLRKWQDTSLKQKYRWQLSMWNGSTSLGIRKMQIKITMTCFYISFIIAKIFKIHIYKLTIMDSGQKTEQLKLSFIAGANAKWYSHLGKQFGNFL